MARVTPGSAAGSGYTGYSGWYSGRNSASKGSSERKPWTGSGPALRESSRRGRGSGGPVVP